MKNQEQTGRIKDFLNRAILEELEKLQGVQLNYMHFVIMGQVIEVLGGFMDQKPMKARGQSARRFAAAVRYLLGGRYRTLNENNFLYDKLRNQMTHTFIPGGDLILRNNEGEEEYHHLEMHNGQLVLVAETFYADLRRACERLIRLLEEGQLKPKNIAFGDDE